VGLSDESLLAGLGSGDQDLAAAFVRRFQARVFGLALAVTGDPQSAEEVAQETFMRAWRHSGAYDPRRGGVASWLLGIARNVALDTRRGGRVHPVDPSTLAGYPIPSTSPDPEERGILAHDAGRLWQALTSLPEQQRRALVLAAYYGRTATEVSRAEGIPVGTAKTRIRTAMLKLRAALEVSE
jgi:RNA polymerase sigma factor (sigma-70 family)